MRHILVLMLFFIAPAAVASSAIEREAEFESCHFKINNHYNGDLILTTDGAPPVAVYHMPSNPELQHSVQVTIRFTCNTKKGESAFTELGLDKHAGEWRLIPNKYDPEDLARVKIYPLAGSGTDGAAATDNQTTGDENERTQGLVFCLTNQEQILCGTSSAVGYVAYPKQSNLPKVLKLLESIEFLEPTSH